jgi:aspartate/glutamate racemase
MAILSVPTPGLIDGDEDEKATFHAMLEAVKKLELCGSDFIAIACNSLQYLIRQLQTHTTTPIIGIAPIVATHKR